MKRTTFFEGVVIGLTSGIILSIIFLVTDFTIKRLEKLDQIKYIRQIIEDSRDDIYNAEPLHIVEDDIFYTTEQMRRASYDRMRRKVGDALQKRASRLSYDEIFELNAAFQHFDVAPNIILDDKACDYIFDLLEAVKWLKLSKRR